jgi:hypothetical protein
MTDTNIDRLIAMVDQLTTVVMYMAGSLDAQLGRNAFRHVNDLIEHIRGQIAAMREERKPKT